MRNMLPLAALAALALTACTEVEPTTRKDREPPLSTWSLYPLAADAYEPDDSRETAGTLVLGVPEHRSLFPEFDVDWVQFSVSAETTYELSANDLSTATDVYVTLYDGEGVATVAAGGELDDYLYRDSRKLIRTSSDAILYAKVTSFAAKDGTTRAARGSYTLSVHPFVDADSDGFSSYYDCDDADSTVHPERDYALVADPPGDGIDQNCNGIDDLAPTAPDASGPDDTKETARPMAAARGSEREWLKRSEIFGANARTLAPAGDVDWFTIVVPARSKAWVTAYPGPSFGATMTIYDADGVTTIVAANDKFEGDIENTTASPRTYYAVFRSTAETLFYVPVWYSAGEDLDGDGAYAWDKDGFRDCDDNDPGLNPGAHNCDGL